MKDLPLSLLSRGCGRFFSSNRNTTKHDGRLDVCFTPQDYYIWKSQDSLLRLSNSGCLLGEAESTLPKTFSTRRGPLLLYSQDFVTLEACSHSETRDRKRRVIPKYIRQAEQQLSTLKELTAAILRYTSHQFSSSRLSAPIFPAFHLPLAHPTLPPVLSTREQPSPHSFVQRNPLELSAERNTDLGNKAENEEQLSGKRVRLDLFLQVPSSSSPPAPSEPQTWVHYVSMTPEQPEESQTYLDMSLQQSEKSEHSETNHLTVGGELHANVNCVRDAADDQFCPSQRSGKTDDEGNCDRSISGSRRGRIGLLPPLEVGHSSCPGTCWETTEKLRLQNLSSDERHTHRLPPIAESCTMSRVLQAQAQQDAQPKAESDGFDLQENLTRVQQQPPFLPLLFPEEEEISGKQRRAGEKTERQHIKKETVRHVKGGEGGGRLPSEKGSVILLETREAEPPPPVGVLGCVSGWKGPGKQSSLSFLQSRLPDLQDTCEPSSSNRGVVRGVLPLELRDLQNGRSVGCLILGPDGEIMQLSLYDNNRDPPQSDGDTQEQTLQVLSAEGEALPWVIMLQPEHTHAGGGVELNTDVPAGDIQQHQSKHKLSDPHILSETDARSPSSHTGRAAVTKKKKTAETKRWEEPKREVKSKVRIPLLRERDGKEELRGNNEEEEEEEEEMGSERQSSRLSASRQPGEKLQIKDDASFSLQIISPNEAPMENAEDKNGEKIQKKDAEEAAKTTWKRGLKTAKSSESDGQKTSQMRGEGQLQRQKSGGDAQPIRSHKQERTSREATETQHRPAVSSVKKKTTDREGQGGEERMNEEKDERGEASQEGSAGRRRRRGKPKHKQRVVDSLDKDEVEVNQEMKAKSHLKSTKRQSATQRHDEETNSEEESDLLSTRADKRSGVQSVSSLRSTAAASQSNQRNQRRSAASSCDGTMLSSVGLASSHGRLSSCSTVMITEEQLKLKPVKPESSGLRKSQEESPEEAAALRLAQRAERRRQEVERKRKEQEEKERKQQEREQMEDRMKNELEEERRRRAEELRLKKLAEEEERRKREEEEEKGMKREQAQRERERRRLEERRRQMERLQRLREEDEQRRRAELERLRLEEKRRQEEEKKKLQEMDEDERMEYLSRKEQEEEDRRKEEAERKRREEEANQRAAEEARLQAELLAREMALLAFKRSLVLEAEGLERSQGISRPWIYSYFALMHLVGLNPAKAETTTP